MPHDDIPAPALADLEAAMKAAENASRDYADRVSAERRQLFPDPEQVVERATWPPEQAGELERLRAAHMNACRAVWARREADKQQAEASGA